MDLSGAWQTEREGTRDGVYFFRQVGSCVWFAGGFDTNAPVTEDLVTVLFTGTLHDDFTISGRWADMRTAGLTSLDHGSITLGIEFVGTGSAEAIRLRYLGGRGQPFLEPGYREAQSWVRVGD